jgi:hypothetical protein
MSESIWERYGPYPKKKEKKHIPPKDMRFLHRSYQWLKWKIVERVFLFHVPCLEH